MERGAFSSDDYKERAKNFVSLRVEAERGDLYVHKYGDIFPVVRVLNSKGALVSRPDARTPIAIEQAVVLGRAREKQFAKELAKADMNDPITRAEWVSKHIARADDEAAIALYKGFPEQDTSDARFSSLTKLVAFLITFGSTGDATKLLDAATPVFNTPSRLVEIAKIRNAIYGTRVRLAVVAKRKDLCWKIIDEAALLHPECDIGKDPVAQKSAIEKNWAVGADDPNHWNSLRNNE